MNTVVRLMRSGDVINAARVMRAYRLIDIVPCFKINIFQYLISMSKFKSFVLAALLIPVWIASYLMRGDPMGYFNCLRVAAWKGRSSVHYEPVVA